MVQVRNNIFETNSSSTHSVGISTKYDYDRWACDADDLELDNTLLDTLAGTFVKVSEVYDRISRNGWCSNFEEFKAFFVSNDELPDYVDDYGNVDTYTVGSSTVACFAVTTSGSISATTCEVTVRYSFFQWLIRIFLFGWIWY